MVYGVDADEADAEVPQLVGEPVELGLVGERPGLDAIAIFGRFATSKKYFIRPDS